MKLTAQQVIDATLLVSQIIREKRPMPQVGKLRMARMHAKLLPEFNALNAQRDEMIKAYDTPQMKPTETQPDGGEPPEMVQDGWMVPADKMDEFNAAWKPVAEAELELDVQPISLAELNLGQVDGAIEAAELVTLGELVVE